MTVEYLSVTCLAERWGVPVSVIYGLRYRRVSPPAIRIGRELRYRLSDVERWEADHLEPANSRAGRGCRNQRA
jgi:predicted DNA-binding transcriptional regulator AlpA